MIILLYALWLAAVAAHAEDLRVIYTGKLLGYPRVPDLQRLEEAGCPADGTATPAGQVKRYRHVVPPGAAPSAVAKLLTAEIAAASEGRQTVLVGLGDNFAMDFFSRISVVKECGQPAERYLAKDETTFQGGDWFDLGQIDEKSKEWARFKEDQESGRSVIDADNVATFFRNAGYAAIVPGKHDFYYGPERVRQLARLLMGVTHDAATGSLRAADAQAVPMLATNMIIRTTASAPPAVKPDYQRELDRAKQYTMSAAGLTWGLPKSVLPWLRRIMLKGAFAGSAPVVSAAEICLQDQPDVKPPPHRGPAHKTIEPAPAPAGAAYLTFPTGFVLEGERSYLVCVTINASPRVPFCQPFNVHTPFFQFPDNAAPGLYGNQKASTLAEKTRVPPYQYLADRQTVIMGAVAEGLEKQVGSLNTQWLNKDPRLDTGVATVDPTEAVSQLLEHCDMLGPCGKARTLILLAQMPRDAAEILNRQLKRRFHIVVAQADSRLATPRARVEYAAGHPPLVLAPQELRDELAAPVYGIGLQYADLTYGAGPTPERIVTAARERQPFDRPIQSGHCLVAPFATAWARLTGEAIPTQLTEEHFRTVVLEAMRRHRRADLTLVQDRDFFELKDRLGQCQTTPVAAEALRASVEQVLWKGDFVFTRTIKGSALKAAMARSREIKAQEDDVYSIELEKGRWLAAHGLVQNAATKVWYVNGQALEDNTLYSVAMTDFLAFGETGYTELQSPAVPPAERTRELARLPRIADTVLEMVAGTASRPLLSFSTYLDRTSHLAFSPGPAATAWNQFASLVHDTLLERQPRLTAPAVRLGQTRAFWRLFLDKAEGGFANYGHNREKQDNLSGLFQGIPESSVLSRKRQTISSSVQLELRREWSRRHFFTRMEEEYTVERSQQDGPLGSFLKNYPFNQVSVESGFRFAQSGGNRQRPWWGWLASFQGSSQVRSPFVDFQPGLKCENPGLDDRCPQESRFRDYAARTSRLLGKAGFTYQGRESWMEGGLFYGRVLRPVEYTLFYRGDTPALLGAVCNLQSGFANVPASQRTLSHCLARSVVPQTAPVTGWYLRGNSEFNAERGLFLNFNLRWNLPKRLTGMDQFAVENRGRLYFLSNSDLIIDTRVNNVLKLGPVIKLFPSVSLKPTLSLFYFENRVARVSMVGQSIDFKVEYRFNRKSGDSWGQALKAGWPK
ncbi:MAG: hypothetical protein IT162_13320 [Bryobacterales bacterium]|nr:hypothetical protein [Bryobacterales bacterium]